MKLKKINTIMFVFFILFHLMLIKTINYNFFSEYTYYDYRNNNFYIASCYGISISIICLFLIGMINGIYECKSMAFAKNMVLPLGCTFVVNYLYYRTNIYLQKDIVNYTALICFLISFSMVLVFLCVRLIYIVKKEPEIYKNKLYIYFLFIDILFFLLVVLGGFFAMNYVRGQKELLVISVIVFMAPILFVLAIWSAIMWVIYKIKSK